MLSRLCWHAVVHRREQVTLSRDAACQSRLFRKERFALMSLSSFCEMGNARESQSTSSCHVKPADCLCVGRFVPVVSFTLGSIENVSPCQSNDSFREIHTLEK